MRALTAGVLTVLITATAAAQQAAAPPRDTARTPSTGTAVIRGTVMDGDSGRPLRRAQVSLDGIGLGAEGRRATSTGADGTYVFRDLPAARYRVRVTRSGYLQLEYGQRRPNEQGRPLQVEEGEAVEKVDFALPRMSGISGRVTDEVGEPIEGVQVFAMRSLFFEGRRRLVPVSGTSVRTDDEGGYRIPRLAPGTYQVMASTKETWTVVDSAGREMQFGYLPTYLPGTGAPALARRVTVGVGAWEHGIDFPLVPGRAATVAGMAIDSRGRPFSRVHLGNHVRGLGFASFGGGPSGPVAADGSFTIRDVPPGEYVLQASRYGAEADGPPEVALMEIFVDGTDLEHLMLVGSNGGTVHGRVVAEEGELPRTSAIFVNIAETYRNQPPPILLGAFREARSGPTVREDGAFTVHNVFGRARFQITLPEGWMVKSITHHGREIADDVLELKSGEEVSGVEILITSRVTEVSGTVVDERAAPVGDATVLVFPADRSRWYENARAIRATRPDQQGRWQLRALPAGEYLAVALEYVEVDAWQDPEFLESVRRHASKLTLADGGTEAVSLRVVVPER
jgi:hypothetical protein